MRGISAGRAGSIWRGECAGTPSRLRRVYYGALACQSDYAPSSPTVTTSRTHTVRFSRVCLAVLAGASLLAAACNDSSDPEPTRAPATAAASPTAINTPDAESVATRILPALLQLADVPPDFRQAQNSVRVLAATDAPGLSVPGTGIFVTLVSPDGEEFVNQLIVVPADGDAGALLEAFTPEAYLPGLTAGDIAATAEEVKPRGAPADAKALSYRGTDNTGVEPKPVEGTVIAFVRGDTFAAIVHGRFAPSTRTIDIGALASTLASRLEALPD